MSVTTGSFFPLRVLGGDRKDPPLPTDFVIGADMTSSPPGEAVLVPVDEIGGNQLLPTVSVNGVLPIGGVWRLSGIVTSVTLNAIDRNFILKNHAAAAVTVTADGAYTFLLADGTAGGTTLSIPKGGTAMGWRMEGTTTPRYALF